MLPLDDRFAERLDVTLRPSYFAGRDKVTFYPGMTRLPEGSGPKLVGVPFTMTVPVEIPKEGAEGVIFALGGDAAGWSLFLWDQKVRFHYNFFGIRRYDVESPKPLAAGKHTIELVFTPQSPKPGSPADVTLSIDGKQVAKDRIDEQVPQRCGTETMDAWTVFLRSAPTMRSGACFRFRARSIRSRSSSVNTSPRPAWNA